MTINVESTSDTPEQVQAALGNKKPPAPEPPKEKPKPKDVESAPSEPEAETAEESEPSDEQEEQEQTEESEQATQEAADDVEERPKPKKKGGFQKRIDKLTKRTVELQDEVEYWKRQAATGKPPEPPKEAPKAAEGKPKPDSFDTHEEYVEALTDWNVSQKIQEHETKRKQEEARATQAQRIEAWQERLDAAREKYEDFDDVMSDDIEVSQAVTEVLLDSEHGADLAYWLGTHTDEAERINRLSPVAAARELGRLEAQFIKAPEGAAKPAPKPKAKPPTPVKRSASTVEKSPDDMNFQEFKAWRKKQIQARRG